MIRRNTKRRENEAILLPDRKQAPLVLETFGIYSTGEWSTKGLQREMSQRGLRTPKGTPLTLSKFGELLQDKRYIGVLPWKGIEYKGYHQPIVPEALFDKVQQVIREHDLAGVRLRRHHHYLRGTAYCGECGARLCSMTAKGKFPYFFCTGRQRNPADCREPCVPQDRLVMEFEAFYRNLPTDLPESLRERIRKELRREIAERLSHRSTTLPSAQKGLRELDRRKERLLLACEVGDIDIGLFRERQMALNANGTGCNSRLKNLEPMS